MSVSDLKAVMSKVDKLKLDMDELNSLLDKAKRPRIQHILLLEIRRLQTELTKLNETEGAIKLKNPDANSLQKCYDVKLNNYGWDQTSTIVRIYVSLKNVHHVKDSITCDFTEKSLELRVLGLDNRNFYLPINNLFAEIDTTKNSIKVKPDMIVISLAKKVPKNWSHVTMGLKVKEAKTPSMSEMEEDGDPGANLMNLMKKMYQDGDDDMKKTIAKAWIESQQKNAAGSAEL